ncbi:hypothetical protein PAECIP112173_00464 [Paenibacillus sp. JJ-100]|uniref:hypothetical protein n=1 Tax=Paenibacillus sp. JJ-100 TaxID=2974896 RepID=UPI0022FF6B79|nr:hypothetical protein [Paenibacillus sp. JJ-100]CAI6026459.1 hypothetical protein PAECIP112173_00464 [Paenibacillus sp. JJ-100]
MNRDISEQLAVLKEKGRIYEKWTKRLHKLQEEEKQWEAKVEHCTTVLQKEQRDVDRLSSMSLASFFYDLIGRKTERLEKEELELLESKAAYDTAYQMLQDVREQRIQVEQELQRQSQYQFWESDYQVLWGKKEHRLLKQDEELQQLAEQQEQLASTLQELHEALREGEYLVYALERAESALESAGNWGIYDMMGGGAISTHIKRRRMDEAQVAILDAGKRLRRFQKELEDVEMAVNADLNLGGLLSFADYFFDSFFVDWMVQDKIRSAEKEVKHGLSTVRQTIQVLQREMKDHESRLEIQERLYREYVEQA